MTKSRNNIYGWNEQHDKALMVVFEKLRSQGIPVERNGKPNKSAILLYLLEREANKGSKKEIAS